MTSSGNIEGGLAISYKPPVTDGDASGNSDLATRGAAPVEPTTRSESPLELGSLYKVANLLKDRWVDKSEPDAPVNGSSDKDLYHTIAEENTTNGNNAFISGHFSAMSRCLSEQPVNGHQTEHEFFPRESSHMLRGILQRKENEDATTPANGDCVDTADSGVFAQMLQNDRERPGLARNGGYEVDADSDSLYSGTPNEMSSVEETSDQEPALADASSYSSKVMGWNDDAAKHGSGDDGQTGDSTGDSAEAKRARVENIISSMRAGSPPCKMNDGNRPSSPGRRPKRSSTRRSNTTRTVTSRAASTVVRRRASCSNSSSSCRNNSRRCRRSTLNCSMTKPSIFSPATTRTRTTRSLTTRTKSGCCLQQ